MVDNFIIEINMPSVKKTDQALKEYNESLSDLANSLRNTYGTSNIGVATNIAMIGTLINIGIDAFSLGQNLSELFGEADIGATGIETIGKTIQEQLDEEAAADALWKNLASNTYIDLDGLSYPTEEAMKEALMKGKKLGGN